jgi:hypothetical protein
VNSPFSIPIRYAKCNPDLAQYSNTPSLRVAGFEDEDDDEHENEALVRHGTSGTNGSARIAVFAPRMGHFESSDLRSSHQAIREPGIYHFSPHSPSS